MRSIDSYRRKSFDAYRRHHHMLACSQRKGLIFCTLVLLILLYHRCGSTMYATQHLRATSQAFAAFTKSAASMASNLVIVPGHSIVLDKTRLREDAGWNLLDYQKEAGIPESILAHIERGVNEASHDESSILMFSGGQTRSHGPFSEALSYYIAADEFGWFQKSNVKKRTVLEEFALDSFQNLLFSICRFYEITQRYPVNITMIGYEFKRQRFINLHAKALWLKHFKYIGIDQKNHKSVKNMKYFEEVASYKPFQDDLYGCNHSTLKKKRLERDIYVRKPAYEMTCPDLKELLNYCGDDIYDRSKLPWGKNQ